MTVRCAVLTISDSRTPATDGSGPVAERLLAGGGHQIVERALVRDEPAQIGAALDRWLADERVQAIVTTGGTGIAPRDRTIEVVRDLLTMELQGFGELFRMLSYDEVGSLAMLSRAVGGLVVRDGLDTLLFALPGSPRAVELAVSRLIAPELDHLVGLRRGTGSNFGH